MRLEEKGRVCKGKKRGSWQQENKTKGEREEEKEAIKRKERKGIGEGKRKEGSVRGNYRIWWKERETGGRKGGEERTTNEGEERKG